jgi:PIN domain nuclease of toxin-antitoxin system
VLWWLSGDARLPQTVVERVQAPEAEVFVSQASLWEMAIKVSVGRLQVDLPELESDGVHRDPFDRLLVCQSRAEPMLLLTVDHQLKRNGGTGCRPAAPAPGE